MTGLPIFRADFVTNNDVMSIIFRCRNFREALEYLNLRFGHDVVNKKLERLTKF